MSISTLDTLLSYTGNSSTSTAYTITFKYFSTSHVKVYADGTDITSTSTFSGDGSLKTGQFTTATAYASSVTIIVTLDPPLDQPTSLTEAGPFPAKTVEEQIADRTNMQIRSQARDVTRSLKLANGTGTDTKAVANTSNTLLGFGSSGELAVRTAEETVTFLSLPATVVDRPNKVWADDAAKALAVPDYIGQDGHQIDTKTDYYGSATTAGSWVLKTDRVNVKHYGATGDGTTDDTAAMVSAAAYAKTNKKPIYIPAGNYKVTSTPFTLDWEGAMIVGDSAGLLGSIITTTSTSLPVITCPGDYNHLSVSNLRIIGPGRTTSTGNGVNLRGDLVGGTNIDFLTFRNVSVTGFNTNIYAKGVANSTFERVSALEGLIGVDLLGNSNSVTFENCAFVSSTLTISGTIGIRLASSCNGCVISSCDMGGPTLEWCVWDEGIYTNVCGGQWEAYGSGIYSVNGLAMIGTYVRTFGTAAAGRYSVRTTKATLIGCNLAVTNLTTGSQVRIDSTITREVFVYGTKNISGDTYASGTTFSYTTGIGNVPIVTAATGESAASTNHGAQYRRSSASINDQWNISVQKADNSYAWADMLDYFFDKDSNGEAAWTGTTNILTGGTFRVQNASNPGISITTGAYTTGLSQGGTFISTGTNNLATGTVSGDTITVAKSGGDYVIGTAPSSTAQIVRFIIGQEGVQEFADNAAAATGGLRNGEIYRTDDVLKIKHA